MVKSGNHFNVSAVEKAEVRRKYDTNEERIKEDIVALKEWFKKNPHLPQNMDDKRLESFLLSNKFSLEKTKMKIENYCTLRGLWTDFFDCAYPSHPGIKQVRDVLYWLPLPKLTANQERVSVFKMRNTDLDKYEPWYEMSYIYMNVELQYKLDYWYGDILIFDLDQFSLGHFMKISPTLAQRTNTVNKKAYSSKLRSIHFVNQPQYVDMVFAMLKTILDPKIYNRIKMHKDWESLHQDVPKEILPSDFGGTDRSLEELKQDYDKFFDQHEDYFQALRKDVANEKLRTEKSAENDILGFQGSFRKLTID